MRTTKLEIQPNIKKLSTTQTFSLNLINGDILKRASVKLIFSYDTDNCINLANISILSEAEDFVNYKLYTYPRKTELILQINSPAKTDNQNILRFDLVPVQTCRLKTNLETISAEKISSSRPARISFQSLTVEVKGQPTFADTVTVTTTPPPHGIEFPKKVTPTPAPPKNWGGFITANIIILAVIVTLVWIAIRIKNSKPDMEDTTQKTST